MKLQLSICYKLFSVIVCVKVIGASTRVRVVESPSREPQSQYQSQPQPPSLSTCQRHQPTPDSNKEIRLGANSAMGGEGWEWRYFVRVDADGIAAFSSSLEVESREDVYFPCNSDHGFKLRHGHGDLEWKQQLQTQPVDTKTPAYGSVGLWKKRKKKAANCITETHGEQTVNNVALEAITTVTVLEGIRVTCKKYRKQRMCDKGNAVCEDTMCEFICSIDGVKDVHVECWRSICVESDSLVDVIANLPTSADLPVNAVVIAYPEIVVNIANRARASLTAQQSKQ
eukprot:m.157472 g.157472  ORF g.157472 m.157472 type:complete len:284 (+) comp31058_c1_seq2:121-972(+)